MQRVKYNENWIAFNTNLVHRPRIKFDSIQLDPIENIRFNYRAISGAKLKIDWGNGIIDDMICDGENHDIYSDYDTINTTYDIEIYGDIDSLLTWVLGSNTTLLNIEELQWCVNMYAFQTSNFAGAWPSHSGSIDKLAHLPFTGLYLWSSAGSGGGARGDGITGSLNHFDQLTTLTSRSNTGITGSVNYWPDMTNIHVLDSITGNIENMTKLEILYSIRSSAALTGDITTLSDLYYINCAFTGSGNWTLPDSVIDLPKLSYFVSGTAHPTTGPLFTETKANQYLADFWANRDEPKPYSLRTIDLQGNESSSAPSGQGIIDAANLAAYKSPDDTYSTAWTVTTR